MRGLLFGYLSGQLAVCALLFPLQGLRVAEKRLSADRADLGPALLPGGLQADPAEAMAAVEDDGSVKISQQMGHDRSSSRGEREAEILSGQLESE